MRLRELTQLTIDKVINLITKQKFQKIAGTIVFRKSNSEIKYLLLKHRRSHWEFPKGKVKTNESLEKAAKRELIEETGIKSFRTVSNFLETTRYSAIKSDGKRINKIAFFYLVKTERKKIKISEEHKDYEWVTYKEADRLLAFKNLKIILKKANKYIISNIKK
jgi:8-oxo-dGTP pyrophosphatase MutT (NUDIX family)